MFCILKILVSNFISTFVYFFTVPGRQLIYSSVFVKVNKWVYLALRNQRLYSQFVFFHFCLILLILEPSSCSFSLYCLNGQSPANSSHVSLFLLWWNAGHIISCSFFIDYLLNVQYIRNAGITFELKFIRWAAVAFYWQLLDVRRTFLCLRY